MAFMQRDDMVEDLPAHTSDPASAIPFPQGACTLVRLGFSPVDLRNAIISALNSAS